MCFTLQGIINHLWMFDEHDIHCFINILICVWPTANIPNSTHWSDYSKLKHDCLPCAPHTLSWLFTRSLNIAPNYQKWMGRVKWPLRPAIVTVIGKGLYLIAKEQRLVTVISQSELSFNESHTRLEFQMIPARSAKIGAVGAPIIAPSSTKVNLKFDKCG